MRTIERHENLIEYIEYGDEFIASNASILKGNRYLALEYAANTTLLEYINSKNGYIHENWVRYWFLQIFKGLCHIRIKEYSHLDIKCNNILLDEQLNAKIADFGLSHEHYPINGEKGSRFYRAPEVYKRPPQPYDGEKVDVFALAVVLFALQMKRYPTEDVKEVTNAP